MNQKLAKIFKEIKQIEPEAGFEDLILQKIDLEREKKIRRKLVFSYAGLAVSFAAIFPAILRFGIELFHSEFWSILSLAFSDFLIVAKSWNEYLYSLGETLPIGNIIVILIPIFGVLMFLNLCFSIKEKIRNIHSANFKLKSI